MRTNAISILAGTNTPATLPELYGKVIENIQKAALSTALKSQSYTGNPATGSVEFKRFVNSASKDYGTARKAGKGDKVNAPTVTVNLDQHKEIVEEVAKFDIDTFGVPDLMRRRADNHVSSVTVDLDRAFFKTATDAGTAITASSTKIEDVVSSMITTMATTKNDYVDGVDKNLINVICSEEKYNEFRTFLDSQNNPNVDTAAEEFGIYHGVRVYSSTRLPEKCNVLVMVNGAVGQPCVTNPYGNPEKIPLSNDYAVSLFYDYGTKALTPDLILKWVEA